MNKIKLTFSFVFLSAFSLLAQRFDGCTLYSASGSNKIYLMDSSGSTIHTWTMATTAKTGYATYLEKGGIIWRAVLRSGNSFTGGPICGQVQKVDWNGNILWDYVYSTTNYCTHHDIHPMPNGNVLLIAYERKTAAEVSAAGCTQSIEMWPDKIVEVQPTGPNTGTVVWEWHAWDHLVQNVNAAKANYQTSVSAHPELININYKTTKDWIHMNGLDYNVELDQIVFSSHNLNEIYVIDHSTTTAQAAGHTGGNSGKGGDILYRWGNPLAYGGSGTATINVVHDAHWVDKGCPRENYIACFNNGGTSTASTVDMILPPYAGNGYSTVAGTPASYNYRRICNGKTSNMGNSIQLPNGNMLITVAMSGNFYEIDSNGNVLWTKNAGAALPQSQMYARCAIFGTADITPVIRQSNDTLYADAASGNQWYLNGSPISGANTTFIVPAQNGTYEVQYTDPVGCVSKMSSQFTYNGVNGVGRVGTNNLSLQVYPNPTAGKLALEGDFMDNGNYTVTVIDLSGQVVLSAINSSQVDLLSLCNGVYFVQVVSEAAGTASARVVLMK